MKAIPVSLLGFKNQVKDQSTRNLFAYTVRTRLHMYLSIVTHRYTHKYTNAHIRDKPRGTHTTSGHKPSSGLHTLTRTHESLFNG